VTLLCLIEGKFLIATLHMRKRAIQSWVMKIEGEVERGRNLRNRKMCFQQRIENDGRLIRIVFWETEV
jgi:hypothetical protein